MVSSSRLWGSFFYFVWSLLMLLILANVFIAILSEAYANVAADLQENAKSPSKFFGKIKRKFTSRMGKFKEELEAMDEDGDGVITAEELAEATNVPLERAKEVIAENDQDGNGTLDISEFGRLKEKLIREQEDKAQTMSLFEFNQIKEDLDKMTKFMGDRWMEALQKKGDSEMAGSDYLKMVDEIEEVDIDQST